MQKSISAGLFWKLMERFGAQGIQFVLQIVLARLLAPEYYGVLSLMLVFTTLGNVFIQNGFNTSLVQNKDVTEEDYSSVFWVTLMISGLLYAVLFFTAPLIAAFYEMPEIIAPLRVLALLFFPGTMNSVQLAKVSRELDFKKIFTSNILAVLVSGIIGVVIAYRGGGIWALVVQNLSNITIACVVMWFTVEFRPKWVVNFKRVRILFSFGWKLLVSSLLDTLYQDLRTLVIGKKYDEKTLGFYNRGKQFPQFFITSINGAIQSVMLPVMSREQENAGEVKELMRKGMSVSSFLIFPMMAGLAAVAEPLVKLLLTEKWLPCVPYVQICCFTFALYPVHTTNLQAINAMGRSDIFLKLEIIKKVQGVLVLAAVVALFNDPMAIAISGIFTTITSSIINAYPNKKLIGYSYFEQMRDLLPSFAVAMTMFAIVLAMGQLPLPSMLLLAVQILTGILVYFLMAHLFRLRPYKDVVAIVKAKLKKA